MSAKKVKARVMTGYVDATGAHLYWPGTEKAMAGPRGKFYVLDGSASDYDAKVEQMAQASWNCKWRPATWERAGPLAQLISRDEQKAALAAIGIKRTKGSK